MCVTVFAFFTYLLTAAPPARVGRHREQRVHVGRGLAVRAGRQARASGRTSAAGRGLGWCPAHCIDATSIYTPNKLGRETPTHDTLNVGWLWLAFGS